MFAIVYWVLGYWAAGRTIYRDKIRFGTIGDLFLQRAVVGLLGGFVWIPWAIIDMIIHKE